MKRYKTVLVRLKDIQQQGGDDSALLHTALSFLQTLGELLLVLEDGDCLISVQIQNCARKLDQTAGTPLGRYKALYVEQPCIQRLEQLFKEQEQSMNQLFHLSLEYVLLYV